MKLFKDRSTKQKLSKCKSCTFKDLRYGDTFIIAAEWLNGNETIYMKSHWIYNSNMAVNLMNGSIINMDLNTKIIGIPCVIGLDKERI